VLFDNVQERLGFPALEDVLTSTEWRDRLLGSSKTSGSLPVSTAWYSTGNNVRLTGDMHRRVLPIRLLTADEHPEERTDFRLPDLRQAVHERRGRLLVAALIILRAYVVAGKPRQGLPSWGSYEAWSSWVREPLVWAGLPDPLEARREFIEEADSEGQRRGALLHALAETFPGGQGFTVSQALKRCEGQGTDGALAEVLSECFGELPTARKLGDHFRTIRRKPTAGLVLDQLEKQTRNKVARWKVVPARRGESDIPRGPTGSNIEKPHSITGDTCGGQGGQEGSLLALGHKEKDHSYRGTAKTDPLHPADPPTGSDPENSGAVESPPQSGTCVAMVAGSPCGAPVTQHVWCAAHPFGRVEATEESAESAPTPAPLAAGPFVPSWSERPLLNEARGYAAALLECSPDEVIVNRDAHGEFEFLGPLGGCLTPDGDTLKAVVAKLREWRASQ
jgi:hypothetical protein